MPTFPYNKILRNSLLPSFRMPYINTSSHGKHKSVFIEGMTVNSESANMHLEFLHSKLMHCLIESSQQFQEISVITKMTEAESEGESTPIPLS